MINTIMPPRFQSQIPDCQRPSHHVSLSLAVSIGDQKKPAPMTPEPPGRTPEPCVSITGALMFYSENEEEDVTEFAVEPISTSILCTNLEYIGWNAFSRTWEPFVPSYVSPALYFYERRTTWGWRASTSDTNAPSRVLGSMVTPSRFPRVFSAYKRFISPLKRRNDLSSPTES